MRVSPPPALVFRHTFSPKSQRYLRRNRQTEHVKNVLVMLPPASVPQGGHLPLRGLSRPHLILVAAVTVLPGR